MATAVAISPADGNITAQEAEIEEYYLDANTLLMLNQHTEVPILAEACRIGYIKIYISDIAVYEFAKNVFINKTERDLTGLSPLLSPDQKSKYLQDTVKNFYGYFEENKFIVLPFVAERHSDLSHSLISCSATYFQARNNNDCRDARILAIAVCDLKQNKVKYLGYDRNLRKEFPKHGFDIMDGVIHSQADVKKFITDVIGSKTGKQNFSWGTAKGNVSSIPPSILDTAQRYDPQYFPLLQSKAYLPEDKKLLSDSLGTLSRDDREYRELTMAYMHALAPVAEKRLVELVGLAEENRDTIQINIDRLVNGGVFLRVGVTLIPSSGEGGGKRLCEAAFNARIDDVLNLLGGNP